MKKNIKLNGVIILGTTICKDDLIALGYKKYQAITLIQRAKAIMVNERKCPYYQNKRLGRVPTEVVESILGVSLTIEKSALNA